MDHETAELLAIGCVNVDRGDGFTCSACGAYVEEINSTRWADWIPTVRGGFIHMKGESPFRFCPNCGRFVFGRSLVTDFEAEQARAALRLVGRLNA